MLGKLLKYDLKYMLKNMSVFFALTFVFALFTRLLSLINSSTIFTILGTVCSFVTVIMLVCILLNCIIRCWIRFRDSLYKDESYLTHTLPVTKSELYASKFLQSLIFFIICFFVILFCLFVAFYTIDRMVWVKSIFIDLPSSMFTNIVLLSIIFLQTFNVIQCGFFGIIMGHKFNNAKLIFSVVIGYVSYLLSQSFVILCVFLVGIFDKRIMTFFTEQTVLDYSAFEFLSIILFVFFIIAIGGMYLLSLKSLKKGVNVE